MIFLQFTTVLNKYPQQYRRILSSFWHIDHKFKIGLWPYTVSRISKITLVYPAAIGNGQRVFTDRGLLLIWYTFTKLVVKKEEDEFAYSTFLT